MIRWLVVLAVCMTPVAILQDKGVLSPAAMGLVAAFAAAISYPIAKWLAPRKN